MAELERDGVIRFESYNPFFTERTERLHAMLLNCGHELVRSAEYSWDGRRRGNHTLLIWQYTLNGLGCVEFEGERYPVPAGSAFFLMVPEAHVYFLASDELQGREAGSDGDRVAMQYIVANLRMSGVKPLDGNYVHPSEAVRRARVRNARFQTSPDSVDVIKADDACQLLPLNNVLGFVEGRNKDEYVIIGAHYDHEGMDELLCGDRIYNGADDNAS